MLIGVVGKPSVGKSTFFKAATLAEAEIAAYPFTTIKPNSGVGFVRVNCVDKDLGRQCNPRTGYCSKGIRFIPVQLLDVAGLVPGAHEGKGMGNQFLDDLRQADVLIHVIDAAGATNEKGESVPAGSYDPCNDVEFLEVELDMWYLGILKKGWEKFSRTVVQEKKDIQLALATQLSGLHVTAPMVEEAIAKLNLNKEKQIQWTDDELRGLAQELRKKTKPIIIACNKVDLPAAEKNVQRLKEKFPQYQFIPCSADIELALKEAAKAGLIDYLPGDADFKVVKEEKLNQQQQKALEYMKVNVLQKFGTTGVQQVLDKAIFEVLGYVAIYPGGVSKLADKDGNVLPDCFLMSPGSTALNFAFKLHTDIGKHFVRAINVKTKMPLGKDYKLQHRDIIEILTSR